MKPRHLVTSLIAATALAGCASTASSGADGASTPVRGLKATAPQVALGAPDAAPAALSSGAGGGIIVGTPPSADIERSVTAVYTVPTGSFLSSFEGVIARAVALGGYVVSSSTRPDAHGRIVSGAVTLKVPAASLAGFLNGMPSSFVASAIDFSAVDHTAQFVDVNARLASAHAHLAALDALLAKASSLADITSLEQQVETVQAEVDTDQGELNVLTSSVSLATATVRMSERGVRLVIASAPNAVTGGIAGGWNNAVRITGAVLEGLVSGLPLLVLLALGLVAWRRLARPVPLRRGAGPGE